MDKKGLDIFFIVLFSSLPLRAMESSNESESFLSQKHEQPNSLMRSLEMFKSSEGVIIQLKGNQLGSLICQLLQREGIECDQYEDQDMYAHAMQIIRELNQLVPHDQIKKVYRINLKDIEQEYGWFTPVNWIKHSYDSSKQNDARQKMWWSGSPVQKWLHDSIRPDSTDDESYRDNDMLLIEYERESDESMIPALKNNALVHSIYVGSLDGAQALLECKALKLDHEKLRMHDDAACSCLFNTTVCLGCSCILNALLGVALCIGL